MRRRAAEVGHALALDDRQRRLRPERVEIDDRAAGDYADQRVAEPPIQSDRQEDEDNAVRTDQLGVERRQEVVGAVDVEHGLWVAGRAGCERSAQQVGLFWPPRQQHIVRHKLWRVLVEKFSQVEILRRAVVADHQDMPKVGRLLPKVFDHGDMLEILERLGDNDRRRVREFQNETDLFAAEIGMELTEGNAHQHRCIYRDCEL